MGKSDYKPEYEQFAGVTAAEWGHMNRAPKRRIYEAYQKHLKVEQGVARRHSRLVKSSQHTARRLNNRYKNICDQCTPLLDRLNHNFKTSLQLSGRYAPEKVRDLMDAHQRALGDAIQQEIEEQPMPIRETVSNG